MPIPPITPSAIARAGFYNTPLNAVSMSLCKTPSDGAKCVPMQFKFDQYPCWLVNLANGIAPPISQIAGVYVDATNALHDVNIYFPDTGYQVRVPFGSSRLFPVLTGTGTPQFYVILDTGGAVDPNDIVNVFALNQFIPEFGSDTYARVLTFGYGQFFSLVPSFNQSTKFSQLVSYPNLDSDVILINAQEWYLTGIEINGVYTSSTSNYYNLDLVDNNDGLLTTVFFADTTARDKEFLSLTGLNYISNGNGPLKLHLTLPSDFVGYQFAVNLFGGILTP